VAYVCYNVIMLDFLTGDGARWAFDPPTDPIMFMLSPLSALANSPQLVLLSLLGSFYVGFNKYDGIKAFGASLGLLALATIIIDMSIKQDTTNVTNFFLPF